MNLNVTNFVIRAKARIAKNKSFYMIIFVAYVLMFAMFRHYNNLLFV
jgi:hypothetical protein